MIHRKRSYNNNNTENMASDSPQEQGTIPSNEEVVESIAKELEDVNIDKLIEKDVKIPPMDEVSASSSNPSTNPEAGSHIPEDFEKEIEEEDEHETGDWDDNVDEIALKDAEMTYSDEDRMRLKLQAEEMKKNGNQQFKDSNFRDSAITYTLALRTCPFSYNIDRAVLYSNRAASKMKLGLSKSAIEDCSKALELNPQYVRALWRRAQLYEETEKFDEALEDSKKVLEIDPSHSDANYAVRRLPDIINERNEKLKAEMLSKLKDLGNLFLRPFGLSTDNFQLNQDPNSGGYSVNFKQS